MTLFCPENRNRNSKPKTIIDIEFTGWLISKPWAPWENVAFNYLKSTTSVRQLDVMSTSWNERLRH